MLAYPKLSENSTVWLFKILCPYCRRIHIHGAGNKPEPDLNLLGHRWSHCHNGESRNMGYNLILSDVPPVINSCPVYNLPEGDWVYIIQHEEGGLIKIGFSSNLSLRMRNICLVTGKKIKVLALLDGGKDLESYLHYKFHKYRKLGEWFEDHQVILDYAKNYRKHEYFDE